MIAATGWATTLAVQVPISFVPTINLTAIIIGAVSMGTLFNRVRQLERRMDKVQRKVFREEDD